MCKCSTDCKPTLRAPPSASRISPHRHSLFVSNHIVQISKGALQFPPVDSLRRFSGVLEGYTKVGATGASGFSRLDFGCCVPDL
jgi:hypothetical protein